MYKVLIADDEKSIRNGIVKLIDWEKLQCKVIGDFQNGREVLDFLVTNEVDILVTDIKMPLMDGLMLAKEVQEKYPGIITIILSAYSDFEYAKQALKYGVGDYIVKNQFIQELPKAIQAIIKKSKKTEPEKKQKTNTNLELLAHVLLGVNNQLAIEDNYLKHEYYIGYIGCNKKGKEEETQNTLAKLCAINLEDMPYYLEITQEGNDLLIIETPINMKKEVLIQRFLNLFDMLEGFTQLTIKVGLAKWDGYFVNLKSCYEKAQDTFRKIREKNNKLAYYEEKCTTNTYINLETYIDETLEKIGQGKREEATSVFKQMVTQMLEMDKSFNAIKVDMIAFCSSLLRKMTKYQANEESVMSIAEDIYMDMNEAQTIVSLEDIGIEVVEIVLSLKIRQKDKSSLADSVDEFIVKHYVENISLTQLSEKLYVNSSYLSRAYKKQKGITITTALTKYRIEKAKELLRKTDYKIYEVAKMVGIEDPAYFTNTFIKYEGSNPKDYKNKCSI